MKIALSLQPNGYLQKDGTSPVYVRVTVNTRRKLFPIGIRVKPSDFNERNGVLKNSYPGAPEMNLKLTKILGAVKVGLMENPTLDIQATIDSIFYDYDASLNRYSQTVVFETKSLTEFGRNYIKRCRAGKILKSKTNQPMGEGYLRGLGVSISRIEAYEAYVKKQFTFDDINREWYNQFVTYLRLKCPNASQEEELGFSENSIVQTTKVLKTLMRQATKERLTTNLEFNEIKMGAVQVDNIYLNEDEVARILALDLSDNPTLKMEQDRFSIAYNLLLRFSDSIKVNPQHIVIIDNKPMIKMMTSKTQKEVIIPLTKRNYQLLKSDSFRVQIANQTSNEKLKLLGLMAKINTLVVITEMRGGKMVSKTYKKWELITTHTTRRSAATNLYKAGVDLETIRKFGGWTNLLTLQTYLKIDNEENAKNMATHSFFK